MWGTLEDSTARIYFPDMKYWIYDRRYSLYVKVAGRTNLFSSQGAENPVGVAHKSTTYFLSGRLERTKLNWKLFANSMSKTSASHHFGVHLHGNIYITLDGSHSFGNESCNIFVLVMLFMRSFEIVDTYYVTLVRDFCNCDSQWREYAVSLSVGLNWRG